MRMTLVGFLAVWLVLIIGCDFEIPSQPIERSELYGRYIGNFGETDTNYIDLLEDSTYISYYKTKDGFLYVDTGRWEFISHTDIFETDYYLELYDYWRRYPWPYGNLKKSAEARDYEPDSSITINLILYKHDHGIEFRHWHKEYYHYLKNDRQPPTTWENIILFGLLAGSFLAFGSGVLYSRRKKMRIPIFTGLFFFGAYAIIVISSAMIINWDSVILWLLVQLGILWIIIGPFWP